jgi:hypothetical protein
MTVKSGAVNELSVDVDAALASAQSAPPAEENSEPEEVSTDDTPADDDAGQESTHPFFQDSDKDADDSNSDASEQDAQEAEDFWEIPAYGKVHKVAKNDEAKIKKLLSAALGAPQAHTKAAKLAQENKRLTRELKEATTAKEKARLFDKLEEVKDDENELYRIITGGKDLSKLIDEKVQRTLAWQNATPDEREQLERAERDRQLASQVERAKAEVKVERDRNQQLLDRAEEKEGHALTYPEFQTVFRSLEIKDPVQAQEVAADLWELGLARLGKMAREAQANGEELELTPGLIRKTFKSVATRFGATSKAAAKQQVSKIVERKTKEATTKAGIAATKNYQSSSSLAKDLEGLSPTQVFEKLKHRLKPSKSR